MITSGEVETGPAGSPTRLSPGDSIHFDSMTPHRLANPYDEACTAIWFVLARRDDDRLSGAE